MNNNDEGWWPRLRAAIEEARKGGRSYIDIAKDAKLSRNYVQQMVKDKKAPRADAVVRLCAALGVSVTYIFKGVRMTPEAEEMLAMWSRLDEDAKDGLLKLMKSMPSTPPDDASPQEQSAGHQ